ncbi:MAG TPA: hypothetical protein PLM53_18800 [Spirochaetota bacterium]|nr:hypothetical protein [Spirochaetota bacterium]HPL19336.1 hypothetical protein [Spirochaetota bacterium]HQF10268.1 hypothetical protein [Spirochaetota bacterium]HQH99146.1 hypothetical protein [Spirochaetota bacterium]HQJ72575.1 hypothetical protein [Spirochaetota bacterium]
MTTRERFSGLVKAARPHVLRLACFLFIVSFLLPYVDVLGCTSKKIETVHGYQLIKGAPAVFYLSAIAAFVLMLVFSFYRKNFSRSIRAFGASWRAMAAAVSGFIVWLIPGIQFLFDNVYMLIGQVIGLVCVVLVFADAMAVSIREYALLQSEAVSPEGAKALPPALKKLHIAAIVISLMLVPFYGYSLRDERILAVMYFLFLSIPFALSQAIVIQGIRRGERWTLHWTPAVAVLLVATIALVILSYL